MKICIMGTGAMACLFGARMMLAGNDVWMVSNWKEQMDVISERGLLLSEKGQIDKMLFPQLTSDAAEVIADGTYPDLVMISSKGYKTEQTVLNSLPAIGSDTMVLSLQNGLGNGDIIAKYVAPAQVFYGSASVASDMGSLGHVTDTTNRNRSPLISIVPYSGEEGEKCTLLANLFTSLGYNTVASVDAKKNIWKKLAVNVCGNAIAALSQLSNHIYSNDPDGKILMDQLCAELCAVANARGIPMDYTEIRAFVHLTYSTQHHYVSMCQDVHNKRMTEIDTINGAIVREGVRLDIPTPVNETLYHLIKLVSNNYEERWV